MTKPYILDSGTRSDPETAAIIRAEIEAHKQREPQPPPAVLVYRAEVAEWRKQLDQLRSNLRTATHKRYQVYVDRGIFREIIGSADTKAEAETIRKTGKQLPRSVVTP